ncbi:hypothetical protein ACQR1I_05100 [Bradyrhizobium sp. HKCCYLS2038]|uniref:hypothetical protein n=1 Tax=unclassified Bradyrhizobium TaxID=2631580 RepID=UPI003EB69F56
MLSHFRATRAAACQARRGRPSRIGPSAAVLLAALSLAACQPRTVALSGADPADPAAAVAPLRTSAVTAPYTPLRPVAPSAWGPRDGAPRSEPSR